MFHLFHLFSPFFKTSFKADVTTEEWPLIKALKPVRKIWTYLQMRDLMNPNLATEYPMRSLALVALTSALTALNLWLRLLTVCLFWTSYLHHIVFVWKINPHPLTRLRLYDTVLRSNIHLLSVWCGECMGFHTVVVALWWSSSLSVVGWLGRFKSWSLHGDILWRIHVAS